MILLEDPVIPVDLCHHPNPQNRFLSNISDPLSEQEGKKLT